MKARRVEIRGLGGGYYSLTASPIVTGLCDTVDGRNPASISDCRPSLPNPES